MNRFRVNLFTAECQCIYCLNANAFAFTNTSINAQHRTNLVLFSILVTNSINLHVLKF